MKKTRTIITTLYLVEIDDDTKEHIYPPICVQSKDVLIDEAIEKADHDLRRRTVHKQVELVVKEFKARFYDVRSELLLEKLMSEKDEDNES